MTLASRIGTILAATHLALFALMVAYIKLSADGQASLVIIFWFFIDFPLTVLDAISILPSYREFEWSLAFANSPLSDLFFLPFPIHGVGGPVLWYFWPRVFLTKRNGGFWKDKVRSSDS